MIACCAGPALIASGIASGALAGIGAYVGSPSAVAAGVALAGLVLATLGRHPAANTDQERAAADSAAGLTGPDHGCC